jgi:putative acetyltransferase
VELRRAEPTDAAAVLTLIDRSIRIGASRWYSPEQLDSWADGFSETSLLDRIERSVAFVAIEAGRLAGYGDLVVTDGGRFELDLLYIDPDFTGRGVARLLVAAVEDSARDRGADQLWVDASIPAAETFEHLGYRVQQTYLKEHAGSTYRNTWLTTRLLPR